MQPAPNPILDALSRLRNQGDIWVAAGIFGLLAIMIVPLPTVLLDMLLALSISLSILIMLVTFYVTQPVQFSVFPTLLLVTTLFRLSLNVATTRLILLHGAEGPQAAGQIIQSFGRVVVGGNVAVGLVVFVILVIINFMVITKGAGRIAEVSARFTLDAMPGKQMAVDAELNAGLIDEHAARARRAAITREADFFGSMDGASKFIRGDAIAGILITLINILGGIFIGVVQNHLDFGTAVSNYTVLTIGDGLVGQVPALIISTAAGMLVTRVPDEKGEQLHTQLGAQLFSSHRALGMLSASVIGFLIIPGLRVPFSLVAAGAGYAAWRGSRRAKLAGKDRAGAGAEGTAPTRAEAEPDLREMLAVEPMTIELGVDLVALVEERKGGTLVERIQRIRQQFATDDGLVVPAVHLRDNLKLDGGEYRVLLRGESIGGGKVVPRQCLAIDPGDTKGPIRGIPTKDPVFGLDAWWIPEAMRLKASAKGYTVVDIPTILTTHLQELLRQHGHELFGRQELADVLERAGQVSPRLVEELIPDVLPRGTVLRVFRNLLREGISIRDSVGILEALAEHAPRSRDPHMLTELVRQRLARHISHRFTNAAGMLRYVSLAPDAEEILTRSLQATEDGTTRLVMDPSIAQVLLTRLGELVHEQRGADDVVLLAPPLVRGPFRRLSEKLFPRIPVLSPGELLPTVRLERVGLLGLEEGPGGRGARRPRPVRPSPSAPAPA
ncbi:MAG: flagellar biosynthesis protein FlhA [Pseudomonadota bacterium]